MQSISKKDISTKRDFFVISAKSVKDIFKEEGLSLTFEGYSKTLIEYLNLDTTDFTHMTRLISDFNLWFNYFAELEGVATTLFLKKQNKKLYLEAFPKSRTYIKQLEDIKQDILKLKVFIKQLKIQKKMFSQISNYCYSSYFESCNNYMYRCN